MADKIVVINHQAEALLEDLITTDAFVKVGILQKPESGSITFDSKAKSGKMTVGQIGVIHEFGLGHNPQRSFLRSTYDKEKSTLDKRMQSLATKEAQKDKPDIHGLLNLIGVWFAGRVKKTFTNNNWRPLEPATIKRKGSSRPLIDTGQLRASISHEVVEK